MEGREREMLWKERRGKGGRTRDGGGIGWISEGYEGLERGVFFVCFDDDENRDYENLGFFYFYFFDFAFPHVHRMKGKLKKEYCI